MKMINHMLSIIWLYLVIFSCALKPFETAPERVLKKWTRKGVADPASPISLRIIIADSKEAAFEERAMQIATPFSGYFRKHLAASQLAEWVKPDAGDVRKVRQWLSGHGIHGKEKHDILSATVPISIAQKLLNTTYYVYQNQQGHTVLRTEEYYVPNQLAQVVDFVHPTVNFPYGKHDREMQYVDASSQRAGLDERSKDLCDTFLTTPACIDQIYNASYLPPLSSNLTIENYGFFEDKLNKSNLHLYLERFDPRPLARKQYFKFKSLGTPPSSAAPINFYDSLVQWVLGHGGGLGASSVDLEGPAGTYVWGPRKGSPSPPKNKLHQDEQFYVDYLHDLAHRDGAPAIVTNSNTAYESDLSAKYLRYLCKMFARVGSRGISLINESGDTGSEAEPDNNGTIIFQSDWPGTCPWLTSVGGTVWDRSDNTEKAATFQTGKLQVRNLTENPSAAGASAGTFSQLFAMPKYQKAYVPAYVKKYKLEQLYGSKSGKTAGFVSTGRASPDIAALGSRLPVVSNGKVRALNALGAAGSPVVAGYIGRLAAYEQSKGRPPLGFLNPWFYQNPNLFNDITCCGDNGIYRKGPPTPYHYGFPVAKGYDAVTGLGSIQFSKMLRSLDEMAAAGALG